MSQSLRQVYLPLLLVLLAGPGCDQYSRDGGSSRSEEGDSESSSQWVDSDGDGLSDDQESALGTDDESVDSDGDGWEDGDEADSGTDPLDENEHPYSLGWGIGPCRSDIDPTGNGIGQVTADFELLSQTGEMVRLYDFCGRAVFMVTAAFWCGACRGEAPGLEALYQDRKEDGLMVISLMGENNSGGTPTESDLASWATQYGSSHPVLADPNFAVTARFLNSNTIALPTAHLLTTGAEVVIRDGWASNSDLSDALP